VKHLQVPQTRPNNKNTKKSLNVNNAAVNGQWLDKLLVATAVMILMTANQWNASGRTNLTRPSVTIQLHKAVKYL